MTQDAHSIRKLNPEFVIACGTQVVLTSSKTVNNKNLDSASADPIFKKSGTVGVVTKSPADANGLYEIEFADGVTVDAFQHEMVLRRREIEDQLAELTDDLQQYVFYRCKVGSKAFGLATEDSDDDVRGIFVPPARLDWSLYKIPEQIESLEGHDDVVFWEVEKFVRLALKANPNVLETLWTPLVIEADELALYLRENRRAFLSQHLFKTYSGYVLSQFRRMKNAFEKTGNYKAKHAMHLIRLLFSGIEAVKGGEILVDVGEHRAELLHIREGKLSFDEVSDRAMQLDRKIQTAFETTCLPEQPNFEFANEFLIRARRSMVEK